ncbi:Thyroid adenoma-associated protein [Trachymyrmex zeteki]|uniref:tRNA (32-2'-O)-methyltransferase regulator THADA n=1 Tax=Mycetomoellerius zeteki TaxID=64791 RepID=A0A151XD55_9HYME|nr:Thyroid adenoma-associated protein [Trachymyrmex zeteki]
MDENELYKFLNDLRKSKLKGELDTEEKLTQQSGKWRNTLEFDVLEACAKHYSEKCRLEMLALLVESKKSTLSFTRMELDLILIFLANNLCEKMEYMPFIKKALTRLKDSYAVVERQFLQALIKLSCYEKQSFISKTYQDDHLAIVRKKEQIEYCTRLYYGQFVRNLHLLCVSNLYPEATYDRKRSCLQILLLMQDLIPDRFGLFKWKKEEVEAIIHCLVMDTYEPNKEMAYQIISSVSPELLSLDSKPCVDSLMKAAFKFGNSVRPIDSVTAAYLFKIAKLSPIIKNILCDYYNVEDKVTEAITLQLILLLYEKLREVLTLAKENLGIAISKNSLYGYLFCIRSLLSDCDLRGTERSELWQNTIADIIELCFELNRTVSVVVNNSSPEGHLPMDLKTLNLNASFLKNEIITPQMVLLCSWRTVKEVSLLFGLFATKASIQTAESPNGLLTVEQIESIMKHLVSLLCETKHRGAFEQAYVGFHQLCTRLWRLTDKSLNRLPMFWLYSILVYFTGFEPGYVLCATRRSAGIPFMIQAVLSSEPKIQNNSETFASWIMTILLQFAQIKCTASLRQSMMDVMYGHPIFSKSEFLILFEQIEEKCKEMTDHDLIEIKIHSMNILRALFRHSQLGDITKNYIMNALIVACRNYESIKWSERNAATLLFSTLIVRIFGVQRTKDHINLTTDNKMTAKIFFERYPNLFDFILHELRTASSKEKIMIRSNVQVILLLLSRLYINCHFDTDIYWMCFQINEIVNLVSECGKSPVYKTRELAARALVPLLADSTAYNFLKKLFVILCTAQHTQISSNLTHGYLLQAKILTRLSSVHMQLLKSDVTNFVRATDWILKGLEKEINVFSCFPIASVYIDILHSLDKNMIESCDVEDILHILQQHLVKKDLLKQGPGEQMYKVSAIKFILRMGNSKFLQTMYNGSSIAFNIYSRLLIIPEAEIQSIAWTTVFEVIIKMKSYLQGELLSVFALHTAFYFADDLYKFNPNLQDAIFDFLYNSLTDIDECCDKCAICTLVLKKLYLDDTNNIYSQRANYLRLLGKCMTLTPEWKDKELRMEHIEDIYRKICDNRWIGLLDKDFRLSVFDILYELFKKDIDMEHCHPVLDWWTMLLQLLVDDNANVRLDASKIICRLEPCNKLECFEPTLLVFFEKFKEMVAVKYPEIAVSALFCWSVSLLGDMNYEMDDNEVFNKCRNYIIFDPKKILDQCFNLTKLITQQYSIDNALPPDAVKWISYRLDTNFPASSSFKQIIHNYQNNLPITGEVLKDIMGFGRDKAFHSFVCERYMSL